MTKSTSTITKDMLILDLVEKYPQVSEILTFKYGFHCIGCMAASMETLEQGATVHGMSSDEIDEMVEKLNEEVLKTRKG